MKILIVITRGDSIGGAQTHVLSMAKLLKKNGHDVLICYGGETKGPFNELLIIEELEFITLPNLKREISLINDFRSIFNLRKVYNRFNPDVISLHSSKAGIIGRLSSLFSNFSTVLTVHGWAFTEGVSKTNAKFYKSLEKYLAKIAAKIIVVSHYDKKIAILNKVAEAEKIEVVHNGIEISQTTDMCIMSAKNIVDIIMIARFDKQKDHETLIRACIDISNIKVHFLGDGPNLNNMIDLVRKLDIRDKFLFYGYSSNVNEILKQADIFVLTSNWEGFPISTLEAMNYSLPIILSDVGGAKEAIIEGVTGFSVKRKDIEDLKAKLEKLVGNATLRKSMGRAGKQRLTENFSTEIMYKRTIKIFRETFNEKTR